MAERIFEMDEDFLSDLLSRSEADIKAKNFFDILNLQGSLNREVYLGDIEDGVGTSVESQIRFWNDYDESKGIPVEERKPIKLYIDSYGGSLIETFCMIDAIRASKTPVWGICRSTAYSGGFFTLIACHKRFGYKHSSYLYHEGATGQTGTAGQFQNYANFYRKQLDLLKEEVIEYTNITEDEYKDIKKDDVWYDAKEALEKGIIDVIVDEFV